MAKKTIGKGLDIPKHWTPWIENTIYRNTMGHGTIYIKWNDLLRIWQISVSETILMVIFNEIIKHTDRHNDGSILPPEPIRYGVNDSPRHYNCARQTLSAATKRADEIAKEVGGWK